MNEKNIATAEAYYKAFNEKDLSAIAQHLHPDVQFVAPMGETFGKKAVLEAASRLLGVMKSINIRAKFGSADQVMLSYELHYGEPEKLCPTAVLMNFKDSQIARIELFYDARPFGNM